MYKKISGIVQEWKKRGKTLGFPTANIPLAHGIIPEWTYKINVVVFGKVYKWVGAYIWKDSLFESHIFDFSQDIYGENIEVYVLYKIRENKKFSSLDELKNQIQKDSEFAKNTQDVVLTFWTFDVFHEGHKYFLNEAKKYGDYLVTIVARDETVKKIKWFDTHFTQEQRQKEIQQSHIAHEVCIGKKEHPLSWLLEYKPKVICLWYDQQGFSHLLDDFIAEHQLDTQVLRLHSFQPEIYKSSLLKKKLL